MKKDDNAGEARADKSLTSGMKVFEPVQRFSK
jgi:hypothetical protein